MQPRVRIECFLLLGVLLHGGCAPAAAPADVPAAPAPVAAPAPAPDVRAPANASGTPRYTAADVRFMQQMIGHHAQALEMTALVPARSSRELMRLLADRISVSQRDEIATMQRWLRARGEEAPEAGMHHQHGEMMPGMLSPAEMEALAASSGTDFERRFLQGMIRHHEGALTMASALFATPGAAQEPEVFAFANDVDADQRAEIARMSALLQQLPATQP